MTRPDHTAFKAAIIAALSVQLYLFDAHERDDDTRYGVDGVINLDDLTNDLSLWLMTNCGDAE